MERYDSFTFGDQAGIDKAIANLAGEKYTMELTAADLRLVLEALNIDHEPSSDLLTSILTTLNVEYI